STSVSASHNPSAHLFHNTGTHSTYIQLSGNTGTASLFRVFDSIVNTGTGFVFHAVSGSTSSMNPFAIALRQVNALQLLDNGPGNWGAFRIGLSAQNGVNGPPITVGLNSGSPNNA